MNKIEVEVREGWGDKPTSGRFVYKSETYGDWCWQCELCGEEDIDMLDMQDAFAQCLKHAAQCEYVSKNRRSMFNGKGK